MLGGQSLRQRNYRGLTCGVQGGVGHADVRDDRAVENDGSPWGEKRRQCLDQKIGAFCIEIEGVSPHIFFDSFKRG